ncbi:MAG: GAF domain-containing protein [Bacteroidetes bacterium]|nr:GAF domain-containing protein [Bacteroidota bacterium]MDA0904503.1 GAF domain-containing protein [Bacteroidota bacterium]MDA1243261.1 GAF domain-containing protein [Bacteroidota bacterium]
MSHQLPIDMSLPREERLNSLREPLRALLDAETLGWSNLANMASALYAATSWHWIGFYLVDEHHDNLVLGPFQGPVACTRLFKGKGVCAAAWQTAQTQVVPDVHAFPGHVACSSLSLSEVVIPIRNGAGRVAAVLDIDSSALNDFGPGEVRALEAMIEDVERVWPSWTWGA